MPGVSTSSAPPGSSNSSRWVVVWRPRESASRTSAVAWRSSPSRALTSVDLPTPDEPRIAAVVPGAGARAGRRARSPVRAETATVARPGAIGVDRDEPAVDVVGQVGLVEDHDRRDLARPGDREVALDPAQVEVVVEPATSSATSMFDAMICSSSRLPPRRLPSAAIRLNDAAPRQDRASRTSSGAEGDPVADSREVRTRRARRTGTTPTRWPIGRRRAPSRTIGGLAMDGDDPGRADALGRERREGGLPAGVPAEGVERGRRSSDHGQPTRFSLPVRLA